MNKIREKIYYWLINLSEKSRTYSLATIAFVESSFFPLPPDPFLMLAIFGRPKKWIKYATIVSVFSVLGGILGYLIGLLFFDLLGQWIIKVFALGNHFEVVKEMYRNSAFWAVFISAFTPIPYKIFTIASGFFKINIFSFILASALGRGIRFFLVGAVSFYFGKKFSKAFLKYFDIIAIIVVVGVIVFLLL
jgi:membrane protein YqaA with SNARE-associated domain